MAATKAETGQLANDLSGELRAVAESMREIADSDQFRPEDARDLAAAFDHAADRIDRVA